MLERANTIDECLQVYLDFETYYDDEYSLSKMTTEAYIRDPRFEVILVSIAIGDSPIQTITGTRHEIGVALSKLPWHRVCLTAHNSNFDCSILNYTWGFLPRFILCTARTAAPFFGDICGVSLMAVANQLNLPPKGDAVHDMKGKRRADLTPQEFADYTEYCKHDTWLCREIDKRLRPLLPEHELYSLHATLMMSVHPTLQLHKPTLELLLREEAERRDNIYAECLRLLNVPALTEPTLKKILASNDKFPELLGALGVEVEYKKNAKDELKPALAKTDEFMEGLLHCEDEVVRTLCEARIVTKSTQAETRAQQFLAVEQRGPMPFPVLWCGALATHRWSAADKLQLQNLKRGGLLRKSIHAPQGYKLIVADLSQIELRMGWWIAGEHDKLKLFAGGKFDPYRKLYADATGTPIETIEKESKERQAGKCGQLSAIYGTGYKKLRHTIRIQAGTTLPLETTKAIIDTYRAGHPHVVNAWDIGTQALELLHNKTPGKLWQGVFEVAQGAFGQWGIRKPDGMMLTRHDLSYAWGKWDDGRPKKEWSYARRKGKNLLREHLYGGKIYQASTQSLARDLISAALARIIIQLPKHCYVAGINHDELIGVVPDALVDEMQELFRVEMVRSPKWAPNLPLDVDIKVGEIYGDIK